MRQSTWSATHIQCHMLLLALLVALAWTMGVTHDANAAPGMGTLFGTDAAGGNLLIINPRTGAGTVIGPTGVLSVPALAVDPTTGRLYAGEGGGSPNLYTVHPSTGAATLVGDTGLGFASIGDLAFRADGTLYAAVNIAGDGGTGADHLAILDKATGTATIIGPFGTCTGVTLPSTGDGACTIEGMEAIAFDAAGTLWGALNARGAAGEPGLYTIDLATGTATFVAPIANASGIAPSGGVVSLQFACDGTLYGGTARAVLPATDGGRLITINPATGVFAFVGSTSATEGTSLGALAFQGPCPMLNDSQAPGSVLVFHKFIRGNVGPDNLPKSEFGITVTCPKGQICNEGTRVKLLLHWVCPGSQNGASRFICKETDFVLFTTVNGTLTFNPENFPPVVGQPSEAPTGAVRTPPCNRGYLIVWVVNLADQAIKFDGLIGDAVLRERLGSASAYNAIPIQAISTLVHGALTDVDGQGDLDFDGLTEYNAVTGTIIGTVRYDKLTAPEIETHLTLLTLDVRSNRPNAPTFVDLDFFNQFEVPTSTFTEFICWTEQRLNRIDGNLHEAGQGSRKGLVKSGPAEKVDIFGIHDPQVGPVTLLGIVETKERNATGTIVREYSYSLFNDGTPVPTAFEP